MKGGREERSEEKGGRGRDGGREGARRNREREGKMYNYLVCVKKRIFVK